jgi:hypothetical protein
MTDDRSLREKVADAARATADIRRHIERLTTEAFAAAERQRLIEEARANARKRGSEPTHGLPRVAAS